MTKSKFFMLRSNDYDNKKIKERSNTKNAKSRGFLRRTKHQKDQLMDSKDKQQTKKDKTKMKHNKNSNKKRKKVNKMTNS